MRVRCSNVGRCTNLIDFTKGFKQIDTHLFCTIDCALQWQEQARIFQHAAEGAPLYGRKPTKERPWYAKDG